MGRIVPFLLLRAAAMFCAALLLFAVFAPAHARPYAGDDYGLAPLPPASAAAARTATTYNGTSGDGFQPAAGGQAHAPLAPLTGSGFTPAPGSSLPPAAAAPVPSYAPSYASAYAPGWQPAPSSPSVPQPAPVHQAPLPAPGYGVNSDMRGPDMRGAMMPSVESSPDAGRARMIAQTVPAPTFAVRQPGDAATPYGYNKGDGEPKADVPQPGSGGYYQSAGYPYAGYQAAYQPADNTPRVNPDYVLGTGDKIHLTVFDEADLSGDYTVDGSGFVRLPLIGQVRAAGHTPPQLEAAIGSALANGYLRAPRVSVEVTTYRPFYVVGAVGQPGQYAYVNHMTVMNAIAMAGGFQPSAVESVVMVRHEGSPSEIKVRTDQPYPIRPGDVVRVETTVFWDAMSLFSPLNGVATIAVAGIR